MAGKQLTQAGINRVIWHLLKKVGGKFVISEADLAMDSEDAIKIQHHPSDDVFVFELAKAPPEKKTVISRGLN